MGRARTCTNLFQGQASYQLLNDAIRAWRRLRTADLRVTRAMLLPSELSRPGGPRAVGPGGTTRTCTSCEGRPLFLRRLRLPISPRPDVSEEPEPSARVERAASHVPGERSCRTELRRLGEEVPAAGVEPAVRLDKGASRSGRGASTCFATPAKVARVGFQPTVSWMKARHVGALHQRAIRTAAVARS